MNNAQAKKEAIRKITDEYGDLQELLEKATFDSIDVGCCTSCFQIAEYACEPDLEDGYCDECEQQTVQSLSILSGIV